MRVTVKLGSSSIERDDGLALDVVASLVNQIAVAMREGHQMVLVTSGAARLGRKLLTFEGPTAGASPAMRVLAGAVRASIQEARNGRASSGVGAPGAGGAQPPLDRLVARLENDLRAVESAAVLPGTLDVALPAAVGQPALMALYRQLAAAVGVEVCQILVSKSDLNSAAAITDLGCLLDSALDRGILPIVNGNDTADPGAALDNDQVAVAIAVASESSRLLFLTNVDGVFRDVEFTHPLDRLAAAEARSLRIAVHGEGRGGMRSKLQAAARAAYCGIEPIISAAWRPNVIGDGLAERVLIGTRVHASAGRLAEGDRWVGGIAYPTGTIRINREAEQSLRDGSTLFISGVKRIDGDFRCGDVVELVDVRHPERLIGRGSVALSSDLLALLRALSPDEAAAAISILLRLRFAALSNIRDPRARRAARDRLLEPARFQDCAELGKGGSMAGRRALDRLRTFSSDSVSYLTDALLQAQPRIAASMLVEGAFRTGAVPAKSEARWAARDLHAIHRDSLVVY